MKVDEWGLTQIDRLNFQPALLGVTHWGQQKQLLEMGNGKMGSVSGLKSDLEIQ